MCGQSVQLGQFFVNHQSKVVVGGLHVHSIDVGIREAGEVFVLECKGVYRGITCRSV
jgi:hypothetical protein